MLHFPERQATEVAESGTGNAYLTFRVHVTWRRGMGNATANGRAIGCVSTWLRRKKASFLQRRPSSPRLSASWSQLPCSTPLQDSPVESCQSKSLSTPIILFSQNLAGASGSPCLALGPWTVDSFSVLCEMEIRALNL